jgi:hypothetical protein
MNKTVVAHVEDLMFRAKVDAAGRNMNIAVRFLEKAGEISRVAADGPAAIFVELTPSSLPAITSAKKSSPGVPIVGFLAHVDKELAEEARKAGVDRVLSRAQFSENLPELLLEFTAPGIVRQPEAEPELPEE